MDGIRSYILSVTAAGVVCALTASIGGEKGTIGAVRKLLCGIFMTFVVLSPLTKVSVGALSDLTDSIISEGETAAAAGWQESESALRKGIKTRTEAYISSEAAQLGLKLEVEITLSADPIPVPAAVALTGAASPYAKMRLADILENQLGIAKENQAWNSEAPPS